MGRQRFRRLLKNRTADRTGFWMGNPHADILPVYLREFGAADEIGLLRLLDNDMMWLPADLRGWTYPGGRFFFETLGGKKRQSLSEPGIFAQCEDAREVERFLWESPENIDLERVAQLYNQAAQADIGVTGGCWCAFYHVVCDFFGMENYFIKMYENPAVVDAVTERVLDFYLRANERIFTRMADKIDCFFMGNDLGTQRGLMISPEMIERFVMPGIRRLTAQAKKYGLPVMMHSCGDVSEIIPSLIDAGIDALNPLQAKASNMSAPELAKYKNDLLFVGGVDTQELLPFGSPQKVRDAVLRLRDTLGPGLIVSPSHDVLLPNVSPANLRAMWEAATE